MKKSSVTIRDVATAAGVSTATVSKYINGTQRFSPPVEAKLREAIERLGYQANPLARYMITGQTRSIGVAILDIRNPHFTNIVKGANRVALKHDYTLLFVDTDESQDRERQILEALSRRVDGMIVSSRMPEESIQWMLGLGKPVVFFGRLQHTQMPSVGTDGYRAGYMLAEHLVRLGHKRVAYLGFAGSRWNDERIRGARESLATHALSLDVFEALAPSASAGERACSTLMLGPNRPDAVICYNDLIAMGFMKEAQALGFKLPQDVSVTGMDNVPFGEYTSPALTTVDMQSDRMGELAMLKMLDALSGNVSNEFSMLEPQLVLRDSTIRRP
ncbi:LacI family DNA-binding transcriptional regulator [Pandoraea anhela]|uniref:LacI family transcriptional regulator n=1 Tax=Pandoraea anhela TaxID=2508295 RepID=A0A5E4WCP6_9BURK|nr:LacI family DNA-binding transcriptional regulator [Pandoraea anhela]VVE21444.1 LacI family transcriptional regulator [Pandoraea anhela]